MSWLLLSANLPTTEAAPFYETATNFDTVHAGSVQQQLTPLFFEMLATTTAIETATTATTATTVATVATVATRIKPLFPPYAVHHDMNSSHYKFCIDINNNNNTNSIHSNSEANISASGDDESNTNHNNTLTTSFDFSDIDLSKALIVATSLVLILVTIVGNTLVILSVLTTRRLRTVTNCFVMNLAITDWLVGMCVMPPAVMRYVLGSWQFGWILCDIWISLDVLLCTGSILSLCAISLDRYLAVTQPLTYSKKRRSKRLALFMIFIVWVTALCITCPPYLGWYEPGRRQQGHIVCRYNQNKGYVVFSAMGSFFIPLSVMLYVYLKIGFVLTSRRQRIVRDANSERTADNDIDGDNFYSDSEHFQCTVPKFSSFTSRWVSSKQSSLKCSQCNKSFIDHGPCLSPEASFYELVELRRLPQLIHCPSSNCRYGAPCMHRANTLPLQSVHYPESRASFSEACLAATQAMHPHSHSHQHQIYREHPHSHPHRHVAMRISTTKRETKTAKTLTIVMGGFIACWLPFFIYYILIPFLPPVAVSEGLMSFLTWVGWVNCGINPFIYAFYNPDFRTAFWRLTCRRLCKQQPSTNHLAMFRG